MSAQTLKRARVRGPQGVLVTRGIAHPCGLLCMRSWVLVGAGRADTLLTEVSSFRVCLGRARARSGGGLRTRLSSDAAVLVTAQIASSAPISCVPVGQDGIRSHDRADENIVRTLSGRW